MSASIAVRLSQRWWLFLCWCITPVAAVLPPAHQAAEVILVILLVILLVAPLVVDIVVAGVILGNGDAFSNLISVFFSFCNDYSLYR